MKGIGIDGESIQRFKDSSPELLEKLFSEKEIAYCLSKPIPEQHFAARFAAKEAIKKALPNADRSFKSIEVLRNLSGKPEVWFDGKRAPEVLVSLSHTGDLALACAVLKGDNDE